MIYKSIYQQVERIPYGKVTNYGQIALLAGLPGQARRIGYALFQLPENTSIPWYRVVNAQGRISIGRAKPGAEITQRLKLEAEGVKFINDCVEKSAWWEG
jgi:methylated-DNA-protein-cysteine methyltransferase-like protein